VLTDYSSYSTEERKGGGGQLEQTNNCQRTDDDCYVNLGKRKEDAPTAGNNNRINDDVQLQTIY